MENYKRLQHRVAGLFTGLVEVWKDVEGFEGHYQVSSFGQVKSLPRYRKQKGDGIALIQGRIMALKTTKYGYKTVHLRKDDINIHPSVHRLVASAFILNPDNKPTVNHIDANKNNNNVSNLEWSSHSEQMQHAVKNDLLEVRGSPKYTKEFKKKVLNYYLENDISIQKLSVMFGISNRTAGRIVNNGVSRRVVTCQTLDGIVQKETTTSKQVQEIKELREKGYTLSQIGDIYNLGTSQVWRICKGLSRNNNFEE